MFPALIKLVPSHLCDMAHVKDYTPKSLCLSLASFVVPVSLFNSFLPPLGVFFKLNLPNPDTTHPTITFTELSTTGHMSPALSTLWPETRQLRTVSVPQCPKSGHSALFIPSQKKHEITLAYTAPSLSACSLTLVLPLVDPKGEFVRFQEGLK